MKPVVDTITDDYNSFKVTSNYEQEQQQIQQNGLSNRYPRSSSVDRNPSTTYTSISKLNNPTNPYSRFTNHKQNTNESTSNQHVTGNQMTTDKDKKRRRTLELVSNQETSVKSNQTKKKFYQRFVKGGSIFVQCSLSLLYITVHWTIKY